MPAADDVRTYFRNAVPNITDDDSYYMHYHYLEREKFFKSLKAYQPSLNTRIPLEKGDFQLNQLDSPKYKDLWRLYEQNVPDIGWHLRPNMTLDKEDEVNAFLASSGTTLFQLVYKNEVVGFSLVNYDKSASQAFDDRIKSALENPQKAQNVPVSFKNGPLMIIDDDFAGQTDFTGSVIHEKLGIKIEYRSLKLGPVFFGLIHEWIFDQYPEASGILWDCRSTNPYQTHKLYKDRFNVPHFAYNIFIGNDTIPPSYNRFIDLSVQGDDAGDPRRGTAGVAVLSFD